MSIEVRQHRRRDGRPSTTFRVMVRSNGRRFSKSFKRKVDAQRWEVQQKARLMEGVDLAQQRCKMLLKDAVEKWFLEHVDAGTSLAYARRGRQHFDSHVLPYFGASDLKRIASEDIFVFRDRLIKKGLCQETVNSILSSFRSMINHHIEEERLLRNPIRKKHFFRIPQKDEYVWSPAECQQFLAQARQKYRFRHRRIYIFYKIAANTGARWGEVVVLENSDLDFVNHRIKIAKSYCRDTGQVKRPKNGKSRYVPLSRPLAQEIKDYLAFCRIHDKLFANKNGGYLSYNTFRNMHYLRDVREAGVPYTKFHNLRRYFVTTFIQNGGSEAVLRQIVGHGHMQMTDHYHQLGNDFSAIATVVQI